MKKIDPPVCPRCFIEMTEMIPEQHFFECLSCGCKAMYLDFEEAVKTNPNLKEDEDGTPNQVEW